MHHHLVAVGMLLVFLLRVLIDRKMFPPLLAMFEHRLLRNSCAKKERIRIENECLAS